MQTTELAFLVAEEPTTDMQIDIRPTPTELAPLAVGLPADQHPALVYLASLANSSHRTMQLGLLVGVKGAKSRGNSNSTGWRKLTLRGTEHSRAIRFRGSDGV